MPVPPQNLPYFASVSSTVIVRVVRSTRNVLPVKPPVIGMLSISSRSLICAGASARHELWHVEQFVVVEAGIMPDWTSGVLRRRSRHATYFSAPVGHARAHSGLPSHRKHLLDLPVAAFERRHPPRAGDRADAAADAQRRVDLAGAGGRVGLDGTLRARLGARDGVRALLAGLGDDADVAPLARDRRPRRSVCPAPSGPKLRLRPILTRARYALALPSLNSVHAISQRRQPTQRGGSWNSTPLESAMMGVLPVSVPSARTPPKTPRPAKLAAIRKFRRLRFPSWISVPMSKLSFAAITMRSLQSLTEDSSSFSACDAPISRRPR